MLKGGVFIACGLVTRTIILLVAVRRQGPEVGPKQKPEAQNAWTCGSLPGRNLKFSFFGQQLPKGSASAPHNALNHTKEPQMRDFRRLREYRPHLPIRNLRCLAYRARFLCVAPQLQISTVHVHNAKCSKVCAECVGVHAPSFVFVVVLAPGNPHTHTNLHRSVAIRILTWFSIYRCI